MCKIVVFDKKLVFAVNLFKFFGHQNPGSGYLKCWIRIRRDAKIIFRIRIHISDPYPDPIFLLKIPILYNLIRRSFFVFDTVQYLLPAVQY